MKVLYLCIMDLKHLGSAGIKKKVISQISVLKKFGASVDLIYSSGDDINLLNSHGQVQKLKKVSVGSNHRRFHNSLLKNINFSEYDAVYIRLDYVSFYLISFLKYIQKSNSQTAILVEIPTYPYRKEVLERGSRILRKNPLLTIKLYLSMLEDYLFSFFLKNKVSRIITFSKDKKIYGVPTLNISNGVNMSEVKVKKASIQKQEGIDIIAVSTLNKWHGYDRLIKGMGEYYQSKSVNHKVRLHIVGDGEELEYYKSLVKDFHIERHVFFYGLLQSKELDEVYDIADIAVDALGRHRVGVKYNSSIKGKEYLAKGLPIVSGVETELDGDENCPFYYRVISDETLVNIKEIVIFYKKLCGRYINKEDMIFEIRNYAKKNFDMEVTFNKVFFFLENYTNK